MKNSDGTATRLPLPWLVHGMFALYIGLAFWFAKERLYADSANAVYGICQFEQFDVPLNSLARSGIFLVKLFPLAVVKLGGQLESVIHAYSVSIPIIMYAVFLVAVYGLREPGAAIPALLLAASTGSPALFYLPVELTLTLALCALHFALLNQVAAVGIARAKFRFASLLLLTLEILLLYSIAFAFLLYTTAFAIVLSGRVRRAQYFVLLLVVAVASWILLFPSDYESDRLGLEGNILRLDYLKLMFSYLFLKYWSMLLFVAVACGIYFKRGRYLAALYVVSAFVVFFVFLNATNNIDRHSGMYIAHIFEMMLLVGSVPLFGHAVRYLHGSSRSLVFLAAYTVAGLGFAAIVGQRDYFEARHAYMLRIASTPDVQGGRRLLVAQKNVEPRFRPFSWSWTYETLLLTSIEDRSSARTLMVENDYPRFKLKAEPNRRFFDLAPGEYVALNTAPDPAAFTPEFADSIAIELKLPGTFSAGEEVRANVRIRNANAEPLRSGQTGAHKIFLSYRWYRDDALNDERAKFTPLEVDVLTDYTQEMLIRMPEVPGRYRLEYDFIVSEYGWLNATHTIDVDVSS